MAHHRLASWKEDPRVFVREAFKVTPDPWQDEVLAAFPHNQRLAMKACKGPGKTAVLAWLAWNFLATRRGAKMAATSITGENLADNLWAEMAKWQAKDRFLSRYFEWTRTRIFAREAPETWFLSARSFARTANRAMQGETLAGLHADCVMFVLDEAGGIPDAVMASAEAALSSCAEGHIVMAGNPTHLEGPLWRATTSERRLWHLTEITGDPDDPKRSRRVRPEWAREQIEKYGRDNPWVLVNVFGKFPPASLNTLIGPDDCRDATRRAWRAEEIASSARVLGVDVARFGDDASVIFPRQGLLAYSPQKFRNLDGNQGAGAVARKWADWNADAVFVDDTGGWGGELDRWPEKARPPADRHRLLKPRGRSQIRQQAGRDVFRRRALDQGRRPAAGRLPRADFGADADDLQLQGRPAPARGQGAAEAAAGVLTGRGGCVRAHVCAAGGAAWGGGRKSGAGADGV